MHVTELINADTISQVPQHAGPYLEGGGGGGGYSFMSNLKQRLKQKKTLFYVKK
jgi:hypothetical protein